MAFGRRAGAAVRASREGLPAAASADWRQRADALPPSSRDTGNRISFAGLRAFAATRDSDLQPGQSGIARAIRLTRRGFDDT